MNLFFSPWLLWRNSSFECFHRFSLQEHFPLLLIFSFSEFFHRCHLVFLVFQIDYQLSFIYQQLTITRMFASFHTTLGEFDHFILNSVNIADVFGVPCWWCWLREPSDVDWESWLMLTVVGCFWTSSRASSGHIWVFWHISEGERWRHYTLHVTVSGASERWHININTHN